MRKDVAAAAATYFTLADDAKIYYVDSYLATSGNEDTKRVIVSSGGGLVTSIENSNNSYAKSVYYKLNNDGEISHIIVEIGGQSIYLNSEIETVK